LRERSVELVEQRIDGRIESVLAVEDSDLQEPSVPSMALVWR
jgi:hypothetical protein